MVRTLDVVGEKWSLLIVRNALRGQTRFSEFRDSLGIPTDVLSARLATLVEAGVLDKEPYREPGRRERFAYRLTPAGEGLRLVLAAMIQWGDSFNPGPTGPGSAIVDPSDRVPLEVAFIGTDGRSRTVGQASIVPGSAATVSW